MFRRILKVQAKLAGADPGEDALYWRSRGISAPPRQDSARWEGGRRRGGIGGSPPESYWELGNRGAYVNTNMEFKITYEYC